MIAVTGMHRSGTSCITGLLVRCGFDLGQALATTEEIRADNPKGHFENKAAIFINERILEAADSLWARLPSHGRLTKAGEQQEPYFQAFNAQFDGQLFKDPRTSVTIHLWRRFCPRLHAAVFCVRNPLAVASSLHKRDNFPLAYGLNLWYQYNYRFLKHRGDLPTYVIDFDRFGENLVTEIHSLAHHLGSPLTETAVARAIDGFYEPKLNHDPGDQALWNQVPDKTRTLYYELCRMAGTR